MSPTQPGPTPQFPTIHKVKLPTGEVRCSYHGPDRNVFNMMLKRAEQDMLPKFFEAEAQQATRSIEVASPEMRRVLVD